MSRWDKFVAWLQQGTDHACDEAESLLPANRIDAADTISPHDVTIIALRLKYQIEQVIPVELPEDRITAAHSNVITQQVIDTAKAAGILEEIDHSACVVFGLLVVKKWLTKQAKLELWDADLHHVRATACEVIAKKIIESEEDQDYLMKEVLLKRYAIIVDGEPNMPSNSIEKAVDLHAVRVIGSSGFQRTVGFLWRGWMLPANGDLDHFIDYSKKTSPNFLDHFDPGRMRVPLYQTAVQVIFSLLYLILYTIAINTINQDGSLDGVEILMYLFTLGFMFDEARNFFKAGLRYIAFWNMFHLVLYSLLSVSFVIRVLSLQYEPGSDHQHSLSQLSYNFLAITAPFFWIRLLLFLDGFQFFAVTLLTTARMLRESLIFFALLGLLLIGFYQSFSALNTIDDNQTAASFVFQQMAAGLLGSPDFEQWDHFSPPFGQILYYLFNFLSVVILLNVLVALFNQAYSEIFDNAVDEYMALFAQKTIQFARAVDEEVWIAPLNLIETFFVSLPFEWWMSKKQYQQLNHYVMGVIYSPLLLVTAYLETRAARSVIWNRKHHQVDEDTTEEWEQIELDVEGSGWAAKVRETSPNIAVDATLLEVKKLSKEIANLKEILQAATKSSTVEKKSETSD